MVRYDTGPMQLVMPFATSPSYLAADYIRGDANAQAMAWVERWPDWPYSICLIHGPTGSGKTHLSHLFTARTGATFIDPTRIGRSPADQVLTGNHCWVLDGLDEVTDEAALAQLINHARARGDYLLFTARQPAESREYERADLASRLKALPSVAIEAPDDALLTGVLAKSFADLQLRIAPDVLNYAVTQLERSYTAIARFAAAMDHLSLTRGRAITIPLVREALREQGAA